MCRIHLLRDGEVASFGIPLERALRIDEAGERTGGGDWLVTLVPITGSANRRRIVLVARPGARVRVGARPASEVAELRDGDRILLGDVELVYSDDALPSPVPETTEARCGVCCSEARPGLLACPRCGAIQCEACWRSAPAGVCPTPGCGQPAASDRELWRPGPEHFLDFDEGAGG